MSLDPSHQSGRPILNRKQTLAPISPRHNPFSILRRQLFPTATRNTGQGIYYNIHDQRPDNDLDDNLYRNASITSRNVINFDDYRQTTSLKRLSSRNSGSHPSSLRSSRSGRLGGRNRMAREQLPTRRSQPDRLLFAHAVGASSASRTLRSSWISRLVRKPLQCGSEYQSSSLALRRIRQTTLDIVDTEPPA